MDTIYTIYTILQYNCIILIYRKHRTKVHFLHVCKPHFPAHYFLRQTVPVLFLNVLGYCCSLKAIYASSKPEHAWSDVLYASMFLRIFLCFLLHIRDRNKDIFFLSEWEDSLCFSSSRSDFLLLLPLLFFF